MHTEQHQSPQRITTRRSTSFELTFGPSRPDQSLYFAFLRFTWPIPGKGCASRRKCVILQRVQSRSVARPGQSIVKIDASRLTLRLYFAFSHSTRPIHCKNRCGAPHALKNVQLYLAFSHSTRPIHCKNRCGAPHALKKVSFYLAFLTLTSRIPGKGYASRRRCVILRGVWTLDQANPL